MLKIGSKIFDGIFSEGNRKKIETFTIWSATIGFIFHLSLVLLNNYSIIEIGNESLLLTNPISAIYTPFSIILYSRALYRARINSRKSSIITANASSTDDF